MADIGLITGTATAITASIVAVVAAVRGPSDLAKVREELAKARVEIAESIAKEIAALALRIDPKLREHLDALAARVVELEEWRKRRSAVAPPSHPIGSSSPDLLARVDEEHERRISKLEDRADKSDASLQQARETLAEINGGVRALRGKS